MAVTAGVIADVAVKVISVDVPTQTASCRVIDNNGGFLSPAFTLPLGVIRPVKFVVALGDVLEQVDPGQRTAVVRWIDAAATSWSESPSGAPNHDTNGWKRLGTFPLV